MVRNHIVFPSHDDLDIRYSQSPYNSDILTQFFGYPVALGDRASSGPLIFGEKGRAWNDARLRILKKRR